MKIKNILKEYNIGIDSLNSEIQQLGLNLEFKINSKITNEDYEFIKKLLSEIDKISKHEHEIQRIKSGIKTLFLRDNNDPNLMGELEKRQFFNLILSQKVESILMPFFNEYSENNFWIVYNWHIAWTKRSITEKREAIKSFISKTIDFDGLRDIQKEGIKQFINYFEGGTLSKPTDQDFESLIKWYKEWLTKSEEEKTQEEEFAEQELILKEEMKNNRNKIASDDEESMMAALTHGYGDMYGY